MNLSLQNLNSYTKILNFTKKIYVLNCVIVTHVRIYVYILQTRPWAAAVISNNFRPERVEKCADSERKVLIWRGKC
jgi:hypothetical protein